ncbi:hypothetical protein DMH04_24940 [Kibdelosporangium aridum]|uniref:Uncharacterized protein n=1 Tax=Kibdelosporangium aridum TaxID=2030 RepID=A0A428Z6M8_KIBAR|nr:hypothetical protein [Kibdelosporangium aridum]RSM82847.1 hypothetical protein DMH04_24940 [Kibdelosporangium aridum]
MAGSVHQAAFESARQSRSNCHAARLARHIRTIYRLASVVGTAPQRGHGIDTVRPVDLVNHDQLRTLTPATPAVPSQRDGVQCELMHW